MPETPVGPPVSHDSCIIMKNVMILRGPKICMHLRQITSHERGAENFRRLTLMILSVGCTFSVPRG